MDHLGPNVEFGPEIVHWRNEEKPHGTCTGSGAYRSCADVLLCISTHNCLKDRSSLSLCWVRTELTIYFAVLNEKKS